MNFTLLVRISTSMIWNKTNKQKQINPKNINKPNNKPSFHSVGHHVGPLLQLSHVAVCAQARRKGRWANNRKRFLFFFLTLPWSVVKDRFRHQLLCFKYPHPPGMMIPWKRSAPRCRSAFPLHESLQGATSERNGVGDWVGQYSLYGVRAIERGCPYNISPN